MKSRFAQRALPLQWNDGYATRAFTYSAKTSAVSRGRDRQKQKHSGLSTGTALAVAIATSLMLPWSLGALFITLPVASARDFSSQAASPQRYPGVRMQQGSPQLDNDKKPLLRPSSVSNEPRTGRVDMQRGNIVRHVDGFKATGRDNSSVILCGSNCRR